MSKLSFVRIGTYLILFVGVVLIRERHFGIPLVLADMELLDKEADRQRHEEASERRLRLNQEIPTRPGFENTKRSGSEIMSIVRKATASPDSDFDPYKEPHVTLKTVSGRVHWTVCSYWWPRVPGGFFCVEIDDETGEAEIREGM